MTDHRRIAGRPICVMIHSRENGTQKNVIVRTSGSIEPTHCPFTPHGAKRELRIAPRGLSRTEAAEFYGLSLSAFHKGQREGKIPGPTLPGKRYDLQLLQRHMDLQSGLSDSAAGLTALDQWRQRRAR